MYIHSRYEYQVLLTALSKNKSDTTSSHNSQAAFFCRFSHRVWKLGMPPWIDFWLEYNEEERRYIIGLNMTHVTESQNI